MPNKPASPCTLCGQPAITRGRCRRHMRGTTVERGYGADHKRRRAADALAVTQGRGMCWRCREPISPDQPWDLGHDDNDRRIYRGPEHRDCNRGAATRGQVRTHGR